MRAGGEWHLARLETDSLRDDQTNLVVGEHCRLHVLGRERTIEKVLTRHLVAPPGRHLELSRIAQGGLDINNVVMCPAAVLELADAKHASNLIHHGVELLVREDLNLAGALALNECRDLGIAVAGRLAHVGVVGSDGPDAVDAKRALERLGHTRFLELIAGLQKQFLVSDLGLDDRGHAGEDLFDRHAGVVHLLDAVAQVVFVRHEREVVLGHSLDQPLEELGVRDAEILSNQHGRRLHLGLAVTKVLARMLVELTAADADHDLAFSQMLLPGLSCLVHGAGAPELDLGVFNAGVLLRTVVHEQDRGHEAVEQGVHLDRDTGEADGSSGIWHGNLLEVKEHLPPNIMADTL